MKNKTPLNLRRFISIAVGSLLVLSLLTLAAPAPVDAARESRHRTTPTPDATATPAPTPDTTATPIPIPTTEAPSSVWTDKPDYAPHETVIITGNSFDTNSELLVKVTRPDGSVVTGDGSFTYGSDTITTDDSGSFSYDYILDKIEGTYTVEVLFDNLVLAITTFTATSGQGSNDPTITAPDSTYVELPPEILAGIDTLTTTYNYSSGAGSNKWAWDKGWSNLQYYTQGHPTNQNDFFTGTYYACTTANYSNVSTNNSTRWRSLRTTTISAVNTQLYKIKINENKSQITNIKVTWVGHGGGGCTGSLYPTELKVSNKSGSSWALVNKTNSVRTDITWTYTSTNASDCIDSAGNISILAAAYNCLSTDGIYTNYIEVQITYIPRYTLTTGAGSGGTVTPSPGGTYNGGTEVNIAATPDSCHIFANWTGDTGDIANPNSQNTIITMHGNYSIQANFNTITYNLSVAANNSGGSPYFDGASPFNCNTNVNIHANTSSCNIFAGWTGSGIADPNAENTTVSMTQDRAVTANYIIKTYNLSVAANNSGGSPYFDGASPFNCDANASIYAGTKSGFNFAGWTGDGSSWIADSGAENTSVIIKQNTSLTAHYVPIVYTIDITAPIDITDWTLNIGNNSRTRQLMVDVSPSFGTLWTITARDNESTAGYMTQWYTGNSSYGTANLTKPMWVIGHDDQVDLSTGTTTAIASGAGDNPGVDITFTQEVLWDDETGTYRIVVTFIGMLN